MTVSFGIQGSGQQIDGMPDPARYRDLAEAAEELGYDSIWAGDHISYRNPLLDVVVASEEIKGGVDGAAFLPHLVDAMPESLQQVAATGEDAEIDVRILPCGTDHGAQAGEIRPAEGGDGNGLRHGQSASGRVS